ncbi:MAG: cytochrome c biogenesis protein CcdA [bacterium]|nr:cytochrome c biogenesis protein CcdA [bacterium]
MEQKKSKLGFISLMLVFLLLVGGVFLLRFTAWGTAFIWNISSEGTFLLPLVGFAALIDSINPCAFSILILTVAFLLSIGAVRSRILEMGLFYIFGIFTAYVLIGLGIFHALHLFNTPHFMAKVGASLLVAFGLINVINEFFPAFPIKLRIPQSAHHKIAELMDKGSLPAAFALGGLVGLCEFPCTGGPYLMVLGLLHDTATYVKGIWYLLFYNVVFISPLVVILLLASQKTLLAKVQAWQTGEKKMMRLGGGLAMVLLGILIFFL